MTKREDNEKDFLDLMKLEKLASLYPKEVWANEKKSWYVASGLDAIFADISSNIRRIRKQLQRKQTDQSEWKEKHINEAAEAINRIITAGMGRRNTSVRVEFGSVPTASKPRTGMLNITVRHMWKERVWKQIYQELRFQDETNLILSADEYRTKQKFIRIFECKVLNVRTGETKTKYLVNVTMDGKRRNILTTSAARAVILGTEAIRQIATRKLTGEENG